MSNALVFTGVFEDVEGEKTFEAKVGVNIALHAPAGFSDFFHAVASFDGDDEDNTAEDRTWNGVEYEDEVEALDDNLDFFEIAWVENTDEEVVLDNLDWVVAVL